MPEDDEKIVPLRKSGPLKPAPDVGVTIGLGIDLDSDPPAMVTRYPDGRILREPLFNEGDED